ncbi:MAG: hypothetical protein LUF78_10870 [Clostridiales bacterium]|nr:hypothetical protein [Clostridiales bacterium]
MNTAINNFLGGLEGLINEAKLPPSVVRVCLDLIREKVAAQELAAVQKEIEDAKKKEEESTEEVSE